MNKQLAENLEKSLGIFQEQIVREEYEMIILKALFESEIGKFFVFKGGTALRLGYGSPRFSEDLDFSVVEKFNKETLVKILKSIAGQYEALELVETKQKFFTFFALFKVKEDFIPHAFSIKFEVSLRPVEWKKNKDFELLVLQSKVTILTVLSQIARLERIEQEKLTINPPRVRDLFDIWFIRQKLGKPAPLDFKGLDIRIVKRDLHKFLPERERKLLKQWLPER